MTNRYLALASLCALTVLAACSRDSSPPPATTTETTVTEEPVTRDEPLVVYASHHAQETASILDAWRTETGARFKLLTDDMDENEARLANPAMKPDADLFLGASFAELWAVGEADALRPTFSEQMSAAIPAGISDPEQRWYAISRRARVIAYNTDVVDESLVATLTGYASLRDDAWSGKLCVSSSAVPGNRLLVAHLIRKHGKREAEIIVRLWRANLAMTVFTNDGTLLNAIADGRCGAGIVGSNVLGSFLASNPDAPVAPRWFDDPANTLVDISGGGVTRHAADAESAQQLLEWLAGGSANALFAALRFEIPSNADATVGAAVQDWAQHIPIPDELPALGYLLEEADLLIERARYP